MTPEQRKEHLRKVAEKLKKEREEEILQEQAYFEKMTSGTRWIIFKIATVFCILLALTITYDTFFDGKVKPISQEDFRFDRKLGAYGVQSVWVEDNLYTVPFEDLAGFDENTFEITYTPLLGDEKKISFIRSYEDSVTELTIERKYAYKRISIYDWFPFVQILLLLPLLVFIFKRQKPWFKFAQFACFLLIFPGSLFLLLTLIF